MAETHPGRYTAEAGVCLIGIQLLGGAQVPAQRARPAPKLLANLIRALPQPRLARPQSGSPPHPISTEGNQPS